MLKNGLLSLAVFRHLWVLEVTAKTEHKDFFFQLQVFKLMFASMLKFWLLLEAFHDSGARKSVRSWQNRLALVFQSSAFPFEHSITELTPTLFDFALD